MLQGKIPSDVISKRQQYLNGMKKFVEEQKEKLQNALDQLGISLPELLQTPQKQICPYNPNHIVPEEAFKKHCEKCKLLSAGTQKDELEAQLQNLDFAYQDKQSILKVEVDESLLNKVIWDNCVQTGQVYTGHRQMPRNHIEENIHLTPEDRLALYHYVVRKSHEAGKVIPVDRHDDLLTTDWGSLVKKGLLDEQNNKEFGSKLEQLAALRDMKRRRQSYRAKNVHITKKTYTEIIREVIVNQMEILAPSGSNKAQPLSKDGDRQPCSSTNLPQLDPGQDIDLDDSRQGGKDIRRPRGDRDRNKPAHTRHDRRSRSRERYKDSSSRSSFYSQGLDKKPSTPHELSQGPVKVELEDNATGESYLTGRSAASVEGYQEVDTVKSGGSRKRSLSPPDSDSSGHKSKKSKKSKHKKKHSKKHKRRD